MDRKAAHNNRPAKRTGQGRRREREKEGNAYRRLNLAFYLLLFDVKN